MIFPSKPLFRVLLLAVFSAALACGDGDGVSNSANAVIDVCAMPGILEPFEYDPTRPDSSIGSDCPQEADLDAINSSGIRFSAGTGTLIIDRGATLPDGDGDGVPNDADDCDGPGWRMPCDGDASNDGIYRTLFYDDSGAMLATRTAPVPTTAAIPAIDLYFLVDARTSMDDVIGELQLEIDAIVTELEALFPDIRLGLGLYRQYPVDGVAMPFSQAPYHHVLDLTDDAVLFGKAVSTLNTVGTLALESAGSQALYAVATGQGLGEFVPNRSECPSGEEGYPCFRPDVLRVVLNLSDAEMFNGPRPAGPVYPAFDPASPGVMNMPPVVMASALFDADDASSALDLGDLSGQSLTLMGMSTLLTNEVTTSTIPLTPIANGCQTQSGVPVPGNDTDVNDVVVTFRFDTAPLTPVDASTRNTHWPGANLALFDQLPLDPLTALGCDGSMMMNWGALQWTPVASQQYYLVADGQRPAATPGVEPEGAFSLSILHDGDPPSASWLTADAPVDWAPTTETALLDEKIRVASVVSPRGLPPSDAEPDARELATLTGAVTRTSEPWVREIASSTGGGLADEIIATIRLIVEESGYDIGLVVVDDPASPVNEEDFVAGISPRACSDNVEEFDFVCERPEPTDTACLNCQPGAEVELDLRLLNDTVMPTADPQPFDFEVVVRADDAVEVERIPVRVLVPDAASHEFGAIPDASFYRNSYDSSARCNIPPERPDWGSLIWEGDTPGDSTIEFQIRAANTAAELDTAVPASVIIPTDTIDSVIDIGQELINDGIPNGLPFIRVSAMLNPSPDLLNTPELEGWTLEFSCFAAE